MGNGQDCQSITSSIKYSGPTPKALLPCVLGNGREFPGGQWLGLFALTAEGPGSILGWGTKIHKPHGHGVAKKEKHEPTYRSNIMPM